MLLRSSPFCCAKGATPVAGQSPFHGARWHGLLRGLRTVAGAPVSRNVDGAQHPGQLTWAMY